MTGKFIAGTCPLNENLLFLNSDASLSEETTQSFVPFQKYVASNLYLATYRKNDKFWWIVGISGISKSLPSFMDVILFYFTNNLCGCLLYNNFNKYKQIKYWKLYFEQSIKIHNVVSVLITSYARNVVIYDILSVQSTIYITSFVCMLFYLFCNNNAAYLNNFCKQRSPALYFK